MNQLLATLVLLMTLGTAQAATLYPSIQAEITAGIIPTGYTYAPGDTRRYEALENGSTDDTAAIRRGLSIAGPFAVTQHGTSVVTSTLNIPSGILYTGSSRSAGLVCRLAKNANCIDFGNVTHSGISHIKITGPGINSRAEVGGINFAMGATLDYADDVVVSGFPGMSSSEHAVGITILGADITVRNSRIENNTFGVAVSGPRAMIINNFVSNHYSTYRKWPWLHTYPYGDE